MVGSFPLVQLSLNRRHLPHGICWFQAFSHLLNCYREPGCPTWIRTMTKASKGPCATITPSDKPQQTSFALLAAQSKTSRCGRAVTDSRGSDGVRHKCAISHFAFALTSPPSRSRKWAADCRPAIATSRLHHPSRKSCPYWCRNKLRPGSAGPSPCPLDISLQTHFPGASLCPALPMLCRR